MKRLLIGIVLAMIAGVATAGTFIGLNNPAPFQRWVCAAQKFDSTGTQISGICEQKIIAPMRYEQPARYQYAATWDLTGAVTKGALLCYSPAHLGVDKSGCPQMVTLLDTNTVIVLDDVPFWYVSTSVNGDILLHIQTGSLVWLP